MICPIQRSKIFEQKEIIKSEISKIQNIIYSKDDLDYFDTDIEKKSYMAMFDCLFQHSTDFIINEIILKPISETNDEFHIDRIAIELCKFISSFNSDKYIIISHLNIDFFDLENKDLQLLKFDNHTNECVSSIACNNGLLVDSNSLLEIAKFLYHISTTSPSAPEYIYIFDYNERFKINICNKGNIHFESLTPDSLSNDILKTIDFEIIQKC